MFLRHNAECAVNERVKAFVVQALKHRAEHEKLLFFRLITASTGIERVLMLCSIMNRSTKNDELMICRVS